jgi:pyruvate/2-oxoglutarate/acetoin dehydrogenase E1 component
MRQHNMAKMRMNQAIAAAIAEEMRADPSVMVLGEDVAAAGGPFKTSDGLLEEFGPKRVRDTPISEMGFTGAAVGAAALGLRPVVEIMFVEFLGVALDTVVTEAAKFRYMSKGQVTCPMVVRASVGSGLGFGCQHSQTLENWLAATPGLKVVVPSDPQSAYGLMRAAIQDPDPVVILEPRPLYASRGEVVTGEGGMVEIGKARIARAGRDATVVTLGQTTGIALEAAQESHLDIEIVDLLTLVPWDISSVVDSVKRTGRLIVVEESPASGGWGSEIVASVVSRAFSSLKSAPFRITTPDVPVPYTKELEARFIPTSTEVAFQISEFLKTGEVPQPWWIREGISA